MDEISNFDKMAAQFKDFAELQAFAEAQFKTIVAQNKQITELKAQVQSPAAQIIQFPSMGLSPEEEICIEQLHILRASSKNRELTLEEAKKTEIYTKMLLQIRGNSKDVDTKFKNLSAEDLLKLTQDIPVDNK